ncbi:hypothetical protein Lesp02_31690 [Lentzea sp. NBRC 105346]|uniref:hypothetical protein n=1 Tax=Lentzea sp. NBRC 105346 TaxID=3032205 RepID=UPI0024A588E6|nr:hypothetical protein [Lentzea sp. NBRC 105346]GLZ30980.1 hypothetical protein Lesp02_31690 [Lentzea sp. NBRC 105346]
MADVLNVTEENKFKGTLFIEAYDSLIDSIGDDAESETEKALDITFNAIGAVASTVMLAVDPLGSLFGAGVGWLFEHISFLRDALNQVLGNPEEIQANVEQTKAKAAELRVLAEDHHKGLAKFDGWTGQASEKFQASMDGMGKELDSLAGAVETKAKIVAVMGMLVTVLRDIIRDLISQLIGSLIGGALIAAASAVVTFGASIVGFVGYAVGKAVALGTNIAARVSRVIASLGRLMRKIGDVDDIMKKISKGWDRFDNAADVGEITYEGYKASKDVDKKIDEALDKDEQNDKVTDANNKAKEAGQKYEQAKKDEEKQAQEAKAANDALNTASEKAKAANDKVSAAVDEVNKAAESGDQAAYDRAKAKYDAAKAEADAARASAASAASTAAKEARDLSDAAQKSLDAQQAAKPSDDAAKAAYEEYKKNNPGTPDAARDAAEQDLNTKNDAAKQANEAYEKANADFAAKNAAAAEANARAFASGSDADIKAAEQASKAAEESGKSVKSAADTAKSSGEAAKASYEQFQKDHSSGTPASSTPSDPLQHARDVNKDTGVGDALGGDAFFGGFGKSGATPQVDGPTVQHH